MKLKNEHYRFWEIDFTRGLAVIFMIFFHVLYDFNYFLDFNYEINQGLYLYIGRLAAILFILIVGLSLNLSYSRTSKILSKKEIRLKLVKRGLTIIFLGLIISFVTWIYIPNGFIIFGVLHFIGTSIIIWMLFERFQIYNFVFGVFFIFLGFYIRTQNFDSIYLLPL